MGTTADEWASAGELTGEGLTVLTGMLADTHDAVLQRLEKVLPPRGAAIAARHRRTAGRIYGLVRRSHKAVPAVTGVAAAVMGGDAPPVASSKVGTAVLPIVNGLWGDQLAAARNRWRSRWPCAGATPMSSPTPLAWPRPSPRPGRISWCSCTGSSRPSDAGRAVRPTAIRAGCSATSTSRPCASGTTPACASATTAGNCRSCWTKWLPRGPCLCAPSPWSAIPWVGWWPAARVTRAGSRTRSGSRRCATWSASERRTWVLRSRRVCTWPTGPCASCRRRRPWGRWSRSAAWVSRTCGSAPCPSRIGPGTIRTQFLRDRCTDVPLLDHATHYWVSASVIGGEQHVLGRLVGDGLVRAPSASGKGRSRSVPLAAEHGVHVESTQSPPTAERSRGVRPVAPLARGQ